MLAFSELFSTTHSLLFYIFILLYCISVKFTVLSSQLRSFCLPCVILASLWSGCRECCIFRNTFHIFFYCMSVHLSMCCPPSLIGDGNGILAEVWLKGHFLLGDHPTVSLFSSLLFLRASETLGLEAEGPDSRLTQRKLIKLDLL